MGGGENGRGGGVGAGGGQLHVLHPDVRDAVHPEPQRAEARERRRERPNHPRADVRHVAVEQVQVL